jgi:hypothetical protein
MRADHRGMLVRVILSKRDKSYHSTGKLPVAAFFVAKISAKCPTVVVVVLGV